MNRCPQFDSVVGGFEAGSLSEEELMGSNDGMSSDRGVLMYCAGVVFFQLPRFVPANPLKPGIPSAGAALARVAIQAVVFMLDLDLAA